MTPADGNEPMDNAAAALDEAKHAARKKADSIAKGLDAKAQEAADDAADEVDAAADAAPGTFRRAVDEAQRSTTRTVAAVQDAYSGPDGHALLLSTTMVAVGSAMVGAMVGWMLSRR